MATPRIFGSIVLAVSLILAACSPAPTSKTSQNIATAQNAAVAQGGTLNTLKKTVDGLTPSNLPSGKATASQLTSEAQGQNATIQSSLGVAKKSAVVDEKTIAVSKNPVAVRLEWIGGSAIVLGIAALVAGLFFASILGSFAKYAVEGGLAAITGGVLTVVVAYLLHTILVIVVGLVLAVLVGAGVWLALHWSEAETWIRGLFGKAAPAAPVKVVKDVA